MLIKINNILEAIAQYLDYPLLLKLIKNNTPKTNIITLFEKETTEDELIDAIEKTCNIINKRHDLELMFDLVNYGNFCSIIVKIAQAVLKTEISCKQTSIDCRKCENNTKKDCLLIIYYIFYVASLFIAIVMNRKDLIKATVSLKTIMQEIIEFSFDDDSYPSKSPEDNYLNIKEQYTKNYRN